MKLIYVCIFACFVDACSYVTYHRNINSSVDIVGFEFGTDKALEGFSYHTQEADVKLDSLDSQQTKALEAIVSGVVQGAAKSVKP